MRSTGNHRGAALLMALAAVVIVSAVGVSMSTMLLCSIRLDRNSLARDTALNVAESGVEYATWKLGVEPAWQGGEGILVPGGECSISVVTADGPRHAITSRAVCGEREGAVSVEVERDHLGLYRTVAWRELR